MIIKDKKYYKRLGQFDGASAVERMYIVLF